MVLEEGEDDFHYFGTPLEEEEESRGGYRKPVQDAASTKALPVWKQEVTDAQGRRRFHGAFTGGYSAGYYNTVGSAEGWAPAAFRSSRSERADAGAAAQSVEQFLDEEELEELRRTNLQTTEQYDTFGSTAAEVARRVVAEEGRQRPSAIPGLLPDELVAPVAEGVGVRLLQRMGWRQGKGIGSVPEEGGAAEGGRGEEGEEAGGGGRAARRARRWGRHAGVGPENVPLYLVEPKTDTHGLGHDPFKGAAEFREAKRRRQDEERGRAAGALAKRRRGIAFGTGVMDEDDALGIMEDYVTHDDVDSYADTVQPGTGLPGARGPRVERAGLGDRLARRGYTFEIQDDEEDGSGLSLMPGGRHGAPLALTGPQAPLQIRSKEDWAKGGLIPGFIKATVTVTLPYFPPPTLPRDYIPLHRPSAGAPEAAAPSCPAPPQALPPADPELRQAIDGLAFYVARSGQQLEDVARTQQAQQAQQQGQQGGPSFLLGGEGAEYYRWKVHSLRAIIAPLGRAAPRAIGQRAAPLSADERGALLGEEQLPPGVPSAAPAGAAATLGAAQPAERQQAELARSLMAVSADDRLRLSAMLGSSFVRGESQDMLHPEGGGMAVPAGGLRPGAPRPPPAPLRVVEDRGRGAAAPDAATATRGAAAAGGRVVTAADLCRQAPAAAPGGAPRLPERRSEEWRPAALLCKRLDVPDPFAGRPAEQQASRFKADHLELPSTAAAVARAVAAAPAGAELFLLPPSVREAVREAQALAVTKAQLPPPQRSAAPPAPADASALADEFLGSLLGGPGPPGGAQPPGEAVPLPPEPPPELPQRPVDLFRAIFEEGSESGESEEEEEAARGGQLARQQTPEAPPEFRPPAPRAAPVFGIAKLRDASGAAAAARAGTSGVLPAAAAEPPPQAAPPAIDDDLRRRAEAALRAVRKHKHKRDKHKKKKKSSKEKAKDKRHEGKDGRRGQRKHGSRQRGSSSGGSSSSDSE